jgi:hypothetical protein
MRFLGFENVPYRQAYNISLQMRVGGLACSTSPNEMGLSLRI